MFSEFEADWIAQLVPLCQQAGVKIMEIRGEGDLDVDLKSDQSPVTRADQAADQIISNSLKTLHGDIQLITEETADPAFIADFVACDDPGPFWLVDPLDGTKEFIRGSNDFTVNIGLIVEKQPIFGIVHLPATGDTYYGSQNLGAWLQKTDGSKMQITPSQSILDAGWRVVGSKSHATPEALDAFLSGQPVAEIISAGSSLKFCRVAEGKADIYPRFGPTKEWDTAAGDAILRAAGGRMCFLDGSVFTYGKKDLLNPGFVGDNGLCQWQAESRS